MVLTWAEINRRINREFFTRGEWAGVPLPLQGLGLVVEDRYPLAGMIQELQAIMDADHTPAPDDPDFETDADLVGWRVVNQWRGRTLKGVTGTILILRHDDGRTRWGIDPNTSKRNRMLFGPFETMDAWHLETELAAIAKLATFLTERMFKAYVLTGAFLEQSKRSGLSYMFRRCRPTIALTPHHPDGAMRILACLCLHPLAYYANTFGGAMVPTDDVIAHLLLMRGDEHLFWRRANQHHPLEPESGL